MKAMVSIAPFGDELLPVESCPSGLPDGTVEDQLEDAAMGRPFTIPCPAADMAPLHRVVYLQLT